jgi:hypothetical protein
MMNARIRLSIVVAVCSGAILSACVKSTERGFLAAPPTYTDPTQIELLSAPPDRAHQVLGEIVLENGDWRNEQVAETKIRTEAARMMADAVIIYGRGGPQRPRAIRYTATTPARGGVVVSNRSSANRGFQSSGTVGPGIGSGGAFPDAGMSTSRQ